MFHISKICAVSAVLFILVGCKEPVYQGEERPPCDVKAKPASFCILEAYGSVTLCSKCHPGDGPFDILSYKEVKARTVPGNPEASLLFTYLKQGGKMHAFSSPRFEEAATRWIKEGANP